MSDSDSIIRWCNDAIHFVKLIDLLCKECAPIWKLANFDGVIDLSCGVTVLWFAWTTLSLFLLKKKPEKLALTIVNTWDQAVIVLYFDCIYCHDIALSACKY